MNKITREAQVRNREVTCVSRSADKTGQLAEPEQRARRRYLNLRKLGTSAKNAGGFARTSKAYWRVALHLERKTGMTNEWLASEGLLDQR